MNPTTEDLLELRKMLSDFAKKKGWSPAELVTVVVLLAETGVAALEKYHEIEAAAATAMGRKYERN